MIGESQVCLVNKKLRVYDILPNLKSIIEFNTPEYNQLLYNFLLVNIKQSV